MNKLILKPGREKSLKRRHPWIFSGAIAKVEGEPRLGDSVEVRSADGAFLAVAAYSPESQIRARAWDWTLRDIDAAFFTERITRAAALRQAAADEGARLVHGESDGLPGVVADRYGDTIVVQLLSAGAERWRGAIADALAALPGITRVIERSDADVRALEGLPPQSGLLRGAAATGPLIVSEHGLKFSVDVEHGHKTGFYLDQRDNRLALRNMARGKTVLDCFCYSGGFALNALAGGAAAVLAIDSSGPALQAAQANAALNQLNGIEWLEADVFKTLRTFRDAGRTFDLIVLDPPKLAPTAAHAEKAARAYKDINLLGFKLLNPGGRLMTYSCSGGISQDLFQKIVAGAALDAGVDARIERWLHGAADHPVALNFPEGEYLKGLLLRGGV
ncbi:MAG: class I SAM-dependent methyltransferase [Burkholderiales bacterium]|jgi:23S rRNA (cytosine1962-C5)-methyltransferase|nr:class I SAM-dependent methyltransferase [Burkholderiales bacterium]